MPKYQKKKLLSSAKRALISGATSGIGLEISKKLISLGYIVYGVGRDFSKCNFKEESFVKIELDLKEPKTIEKSIPKEIDFDLLVNAVGVGIFEPFEEINPKKIDEIISINLTSSLIITNLLLRGLKRQKGYIFNITSIEATKSSKFSALYSATKSAIRAFSHSLFEEVRKSGVKVVSINPDMTKTPFFDTLKFQCSEDSECYINPKEIANFIEFALSSDFVVTDITIRPQKFGIVKKSQ